MKVYKEIAIPAKKQMQVTHKVCDICGEKGKNNWNGADYNVNETEINVTIKQKEGFECSDGGSGTEYDIDLCPKCFKNKLIPWLRSQGAHIQETEWDF